ncbi:glycoside hydrolase family 15 protein [Nigerium massiliense]|uniref:glycoside hydrolase family 15 protein n=1 Tax=Nigerium massiliense TaxID=1522317 RepID=UPI00058C44C2|nr:glycoside hydrolase family 15 protein [Nigerium massiliense]
MTEPAHAISDYAFIGDRRTGALICPHGSVDWLCLPDFDSPAAFAALLGDETNGHWLIGPDGPASTTRRYLPDSLVLETTHTTSTGRVRVIDFMPAGSNRADLVRRVEGVEGQVTMRHEFVVRGWYGLRKPWTRRETVDGEDCLDALTGPDGFRLHGPFLPEENDVGGCTFEVRAGDVADFDLVWSPSHTAPRTTVEPQLALETTLRLHREWLDSSVLDVPHAEVVRRSLLVLRHLTHAEWGGIVAAPTTSLPEDMVGERNWDYRFCWLRDSALTLEALITAGYRHKAESWRNWLLRAVAGNPQRMQIMYRIDGGHDLPERELDHLPGYAGSRPVRIGNGAVGQRQTDVLGEVMVALEQARRAGLAEDADSAALQCELVDDLADHWREPDNGIWEIRGPLHHFTHSRVMVWAAFDRAVRAVESGDFPADQRVERWRTVREAVREEVDAKGVHEEGYFTQHDDTDEVDASLLLLPSVGFCAWDDPRFVKTVEIVERDLLRDGLVLRYRTTSGVDGLAGDEHPFVMCCFWLVSAYAHLGRLDEANALMERMVGLMGELQLMSEEVDGEGTWYGNYPQAFSHLGLVRAAFDLRRARQEA